MIFDWKIVQAGQRTVDDDGQPGRKLLVTQIKRAESASAALVKGYCKLLVVVDVNRSGDGIDLHGETRSGLTYGVQPHRHARQASKAFSVRLTLLTDGTKRLQRRVG